MKPIDNQFTKHGFTHTLKTREGRWCVFERTKGSVTHYEVVMPVVTNTECVDGKWIKCGPREVYPSTEQWGARGFTLLTYQDALDKLRALAGFA